MATWGENELFLARVRGYSARDRGGRNIPFLTCYNVLNMKIFEESLKPNFYIILHYLSCIKSMEPLLHIVGWEQERLIVGTSRDDVLNKA